MYLLIYPYLTSILLLLELPKLFFLSLSDNLEYTYYQGKKKKNTSSVSSLLSHCSILSNIPSPHLATEIVLEKAAITKLCYLVSFSFPHYLVSYSCSRLVSQHHMKSMVTPFNLTIPFFLIYFLF